MMVMRVKIMKAQPFSIGLLNYLLYDLQIFQCQHELIIFVQVVPAYRAYTQTVVKHNIFFYFASRQTQIRISLEIEVTKDNSGLTVHSYNLEQKCKDLVKLLKVIKEIEAKEENKKTPLVINLRNYVSIQGATKQEIKGATFCRRLNGLNFIHSIYMRTKLQRKDAAIFRRFSGTNYIHSTYLLLQDIDYNNIGAEGCSYLSKAQWPNLHTLYHDGNNIGNEGCIYVSKAQWNKLHILYLGDNNIGEEGCSYLSKAEWNNIHTLYLWKNHISSEGCRQLSKAQWIKLQILSLQHNNIGAEGCRHLSKAQWTNLHKISLYGNKIGDEGCKHLSQALWANIQTLYLGHNIIGDVGCRHLSQTQWPNLHRLQLVQNKISKTGQAYVKNICQQVYFHQREN